MSQYFKESKVDNAAIVKKAQALKKEATNVYGLSMPLLADPALYDATQFEKLLKETKEYKEGQPNFWMNTDGFRLWMRGRQLLVAMHAKQPQAAEAIAEQMHLALVPKVYAPTGGYDGDTLFASWALGYLQAYYARHDEAAYADMYAPLQSAVKYQRDHYKTLQGEDKEKFFSDMMWTYAMAIQATAWKQDKEACIAYMKELATLTGPKSTLAASIRKMPDDQFPAWLASIVYGSALLINDPQAASIGMELNAARVRSTKEEDRMLSGSTQRDYQALAKELISASKARNHFGQEPNARL